MANTVTPLAGIYVASRVSRAPMWRYLRAEGYPIIASWIDEAGDDETDDFGELWLRIQREIAGSRGLIFYGDTSDAPWKGALVEIGIALALGRPVKAIIIGSLQDRTMRPVGSWLAHPNVERCASFQYAMESFGVVGGSAPSGDHR